MVLINVTGIVQAADSTDDIEIDTSNEIVVFFDSTNSGWSNFNYMYCMIYNNNGNITEYGSKKSRCTDEGNGIWKFTSDDYYLEDNDYLIYFCTDNWQNSSSILFDKSCFGDTAYCDGTTSLNDYSRQLTNIFWKNHDNSKYASLLTIKSNGEVTGNYCLNYTTPYDMFIGFLKSSYSTAITNSDKDEQTFINEIGYKLGLSGVEVERAIIYSGKNIKWYREYYIEPTAPTEPTQPTESQPKILGDVDGDGEVSIIDATCIQRYLCQLPVYAEGIGEPIK